MTRLEAFAATIKRIRLAAGYTQQEFADEIGVLQQKVCEMETGEHCKWIVANGLMLLAICEAFDVSLEDLVG